MSWDVRERGWDVLLSIVHQWAFVGVVEECALPFTIFLLTSSILFSSHSMPFVYIILNVLRSRYIDDIRDEQESEDETLL
jgi:hypothetical protein